MSGADLVLEARQRDAPSSVLYVNSKEPHCGVYQFGRALRRH